MAVAVGAFWSHVAVQVHASHVEDDSRQGCCWVCMKAEPHSFFKLITGVQPAHVTHILHQLGRAIGSTVSGNFAQTFYLRLFSDFDGLLCLVMAPEQSLKLGRL